MGINYILFDDVDSRDYNIEVFFNDIDRTPKRVYTKIDVAGRNGSILLDEGRYEDVPITYDCIALDDEDRRDFLNALASKIGYFRLTDSFNSDEYYSAVFDGDIEPHLTPERDKSTFSIYFTRYPQRWLTAGETKITVSNYEMINNPTSFDSSPLLEANGYGTITLSPVVEDGGGIELLDGYTINLNGEAMGAITVAESSYTESGEYVMPLGNYSGMYNSSDTITISLRSVGIHLYASPETSTWFFSTSADSTFVTQAGQGSPSATPTITDWRRDGNNWEMNASVTNISFPANANFGRKTVGEITATIPLTNGSSTANMTLAADIEVEYIQNTLIEIYLTPTKTSSVDISGIAIAGTNGRDGGAIISMRSTVIESTASTLGDPTYIDCDLGEAYMIRDGNYVGLNSFIDLGSDLPKLTPGKTAFIFDNTITQLKLVPRWWIL